MRYSNISAEETKKGTMQKHYDLTSAMAVLSRLRASATMGHRSPRTTSSDDVSLSIPSTLASRTTNACLGIQDLMSLDLPRVQSVDPSLCLPSTSSRSRQIKLEDEIWGVAFASPSLPQATVQCGIPSTTNPQVRVIVWAARARGSMRWGAVGTIVVNRVTHPVSMESVAGSTSHGAIQCLT